LSSNRAHPNFLGLEPPLGERERARFHVLPVPYEATVSWGKGASRGPEAILEASTQVELFDGTSVPAEAGIFTDDPVDAAGDAPERAIERVQERVTEVFRAGRTPVMLGGEHTVTLGALRAAVACGERFGLVQFDAHADLRDAYEGTRFSHACVMRRALELDVPLFHIGGRSWCSEEAEVRCRHRVGHLDAADLAATGVPDELLDAGFPERIYLTFDVDAFDSSLMPATGTPEPGGLFWYEALELLGKAVQGRRVIGFDVTELAPYPGLHAADFTAARLVYAIMGLILKAERTGGA